MTTAQGPGGLPPSDEVHVWHGLIADPPGDGSDGELAVLSAAERARAARFLRPIDRARFVTSHAAARRVLARYLQMDPADIRLGRAPCCRCGSLEHGRPRIEWPVTDLDHNLSHSGRHWLLAVAVGRPVGVDVECHRPIDVAQMSSASLTGPERAYVDSQPESEQLAAFHRCWTRKEAVFKACGVGLAGTLSSLEVRPDQHTAVQVRYASGTCPDTWLVQDLPGGADWAAAVAQPAAGAGPVTITEYPRSNRAAHEPT